MYLLEYIIKVTRASMKYKACGVVTQWRIVYRIVCYFFANVGGREGGRRWGDVEIYELKVTRDGSAPGAAVKITIVCLWNVRGITASAFGNTSQPPQLYTTENRCFQYVHTKNHFENFTSPFRFEAI